MTSRWRGWLASPLEYHALLYAGRGTVCVWGVGGYACEEVFVCVVAALQAPAGSSRDHHGLARQEPHPWPQLSSVPSPTAINAQLPPSSVPIEPPSTMQLARLRQPSRLCGLGPSADLRPHSVPRRGAHPKSAPTAPATVGSRRRGSRRRPYYTHTACGCRLARSGSSGPSSVQLHPPRCAHLVSHRIVSMFHLMRYPSPHLRHNTSLCPRLHLES